MCNANPPLLAHAGFPVVQEFSTETVDRFVPPGMVSPEGFFVSFPHRHEIDGAFAARLRRRVEASAEL